MLPNNLHDLFKNLFDKKIKYDEDQLFMIYDYVEN